jgi:dTMP kinase
MFFLDITPEESLRRIGSRHEETEMFENIDSLRENRERSRKFTYNWNVVSADDAPDVISEKIIEKCFSTD